MKRSLALTVLVCRVTFQIKRRGFTTLLRIELQKSMKGQDQNQRKHVDTGSIPADDTSRELSPKQFIQNMHPINGPTFLWCKEGQWPEQLHFPGEIKEDDAEIKKENKSFSAACTVDMDVINPTTQFYSLWHKLKKVKAWILRYYSNLLAVC